MLDSSSMVVKLPAGAAAPHSFPAGDDFARRAFVAVGEQVWALALDVFDVGEYGAQVLAHRLGGSLEVSGFEAVDYCGVLFDQVGDGTGVAQSESSGPVQMSFRGFDGSPCGGMSSGCEE